MTQQEKEVLCKYGFSVGLVVAYVEDLIETIEYGDEIDEKTLDGIKEKIVRLRTHEVEYREVLGMNK